MLHVWYLAGARVQKRVLITHTWANSTKARALQVIFLSWNQYQDRAKGQRRARRQRDLSLPRCDSLTRRPPSPMPLFFFTAPSFLCRTHYSDSTMPPRRPPPPCWRSADLRLPNVTNRYHAEDGRAPDILIWKRAFQYVTGRPSIRDVSLTCPAPDKPGVIDSFNFFWTQFHMILCKIGPSYLQAAAPDVIDHCLIYL